jgi:pSer/pThr/pTyr-binding forkhead associated (FHA) protein
LLLARRPDDRRRCADCGATLEPWERECAACQIRELEAALTADAGDGRVLGPADTIQVGPAPQLLVRERGGPARLVHLPPEGVFPVGRAPEVNALIVRDPTVSGRHFKLVHRDGEWYVIDLETTNGTTVNGRRTRFQRLRPGDVIQAGTTQLTFDIRVRRVG